MDEILQQLRTRKVRPSYDQIRAKSNAEHGFASQGSSARAVDNARKPVRGVRPRANAVQVPHRGPINSGKSVLVRLYQHAFQRVYVFSPSIFIDSAWKPVFKYVEKTLGVDSEQEQWAFDEWTTRSSRRSSRPSPQS